MCAKTRCAETTALPQHVIKQSRQRSDRAHTDLSHGQWQRTTWLSYRRTRQQRNNSQEKVLVGPEVLRARCCSLPPFEQRVSRLAERRQLTATDDDGDARLTLQRLEGLFVWRTGVAEPRKTLAPMGGEGFPAPLRDRELNAHHGRLTSASATTSNLDTLNRVLDRSLKSAGDW